ncbi:uracil-xanthine permease [Klebsiella pneumoniae]|uniref:Uracil-xanthine permease n=1 Tax=Klebsiella pneumoniae TaxID=573 RepID=A0A377X8M2_KLEPN|nr:uracil-xanthine permease [Klebsiella pneumoniae]
MSDEHHSGLLYGLEQRIPPLPAFFSALQHVLAGLVGIITPPLIIGATLGLGDWLPYLISMSLLASGIGTFLQSNRVWGIGAGMICMQGTSFAFLGVTVAGGMWVKAQGGGPQDMMAMLFGVNFVAALVPVIVSRFIEPLKKIFTPIITGSVIALIGISLIKVSVINWCGGEKAEDFASMSNIALGAGTLGVIVLLSCAKNRWLRLSSVVVGIAVGCIAAGLSGQFHLHSLGDTLFRLPTLFPFGFQFNSAIFLPVALVSLVCILEAVGDLTANSLISQQSVDDRAFRNRLKGGILADGVSCMVAAMLCAFPNTTFAQKQRRDPDDRGGQPLCRTLHWCDSDPAWAVSPGGRTAAADPGAGAGGRHDGDVWLRGGGRDPDYYPDPAEPSRCADRGAGVWRGSWRGVGAGVSQPFSADGRRSVRFGGHQRWAGSDSAEPYSAAGAGGDENDKELG